MWPLALLVFFASITVPVLKLIGLTVMLISTADGSRRRLRDRTVLYRIVEFVGRWSMIDVFMMSILVGLVQFGDLATIEPGVGAVSFASVVILTMLAAESFDPRRCGTPWKHQEGASRDRYTGRPHRRAPRRACASYLVGVGDPDRGGRDRGFSGRRTVSEQGPAVVISFHSAEGLEPGKTRVKFKDVELGIVVHVALSPDLSHVEVHAQMHKGAESFLTDRARFWVVRPRLSASGVSGLETLVSGSYIAVDPGPSGGERQLAFTGLEDPPIVRSDVAGRAFVLKAARIGSLGPGSPVFFRDFSVGYVLGYDPGVMVERRDPRLRAGTLRSVSAGRLRFWNASGLSIKFGSDGVDVQMASLQALIAGGITFDTPQSAVSGELQRRGRRVPLYTSERTRFRTLPSQVPFVSYLRTRR